MKQKKKNCDDSDRLIKNYEKLHVVLNKIDTTINNIIQLLTEIDQLLEIPEDISKDLTVVDDILTIVIDLCTALAPVPYVGEVATPLSNILRSIRPPIHSVRMTSNRIGNEIKPYIKEIVRFRDDLRKINNEILKLDHFVVLESNSLKTTILFFHKIPQGRYTALMSRSLETFSGEINQILAEPSKVIDELVKQGSLMKEALDEINLFFKRLKKLSQPIKPFLDDLQAMQNEFNQINKVLNKKIGIGEASITINELLTVGKGVPMYKEMMQKATHLLDKPLKLLDLKVDEKSPRANLIQETFNGLLKKLSVNASIIKILKAKSTSILSSNNFTKQIENLALK